MVALERIIPTWGAAAGIGCLIALPVIGIVMEKVVIFFMWPWASIDGIYDFNINAPTELYLIDLFGGLLLVAISEELVSRKLAWLWLSRIGLSATHICIISAFFFGTLHWGRGSITVVSAFFIGVLYMAAYIKLGRIWPLVGAHFLHNFYVFGPFDL